MPPRMLWYCYAEDVQTYTSITFKIGQDKAILKVGYEKKIKLGI